MLIGCPSDFNASWSRPRPETSRPRPEPSRPRPQASRPSKIGLETFNMPAVLIVYRVSLVCLLVSEEIACLHRVRVSSWIISFSQFWTVNYLKLVSNPSSTAISELFPVRCRVVDASFFRRRLFVVTMSACWDVDCVLSSLDYLVGLLSCRNQMTVSTIHYSKPFIAYTGACVL